MRILHVTDTHLGARRFVRGAPAGWSRAHDHLHAFETALQPALREEVDLVVHSGDVFDRSRPPARDVARWAELVGQVARRVPVVAIAGNHDRRGLLRHLPRPPAGVTVVDRPDRVVVAGVALACTPFRTLHRVARGQGSPGFHEVWAADAHHAWGGGADLLLAHHAFDGAAAPGIVFRASHHADTVGEAQLPRGVRHVLCGHLHPRQVVRVGGAEVVMPGSAERTAFSERHETKGYAIWELGREVRWRFVDLPARPMAVVDEPRHLDALGPGTLARCATAQLEREATARGAWLVGPPPDAPAPSRSAPPRAGEAPQLGLFAG